MSFPRLLVPPGIWFQGPPHASFPCIQHLKLNPLSASPMKNCLQQVKRLQKYEHFARTKPYCVTNNPHGPLRDP